MLQRAICVFLISVIYILIQVTVKVANEDYFRFGNDKAEKPPNRQR